MRDFMRFSVAVFFLLSSFSLFGGVKIVTESIDHESNEKNIATLMIQGDMVLMETKGADAQTVIYDLVKKEVNIINHKDKTWMKMTKDQIDKSREYMKKQMQTVIDQQKTALAQLPAEQRAAVEAQMQVMLGDKDNIPVKYTATGKKGKWGKHECTVYDGMIGNIKVEEICTIAQNKIPCSAGELDKLKQISVDYGPKGEAESAWNDVKLNGVPVIIKYFQKGAVVTTNTFATFEKADIPAGKFTVPADYKQTPSPFDAIQVPKENK
ncbi:MAG TPA: hypothetical protein PLZ43_10030 [bacterium]|nr:hypothetical protein [bacterium]